MVKSVPLAAGKKPQVATKVAKKTQPSTGTKAGTSGDPTYEPGEGEGQGNVNESESESEDVIHPLIEEDLYVYECYNVDISDGHYNTKTNMRSSMQAKPGLVLTVVSSERVMTKELCTSIIGHE